MNDIISEINTIMNFFALVDQCQCLGRKGYSSRFILGTMHKISEAISTELVHPQSKALWNELNKEYLGHD